MPYAELYWFFVFFCCRFVSWLSVSWLSVSWLSVSCIWIKTHCRFCSISKLINCHCKCGLSVSVFLIVLKNFLQIVLKNVPPSVIFLNSSVVLVVDHHILEKSNIILQDGTVPFFLFSRFSWLRATIGTCQKSQKYSQIPHSRTSSRVVPM